MRGLAFIASDALASVSCLDSDNLVQVSSTLTGDIPPELSHTDNKSDSFAYIITSCYTSDRFYSVIINTRALKRLIVG
jgi:hypothetical protein